MAGYIGTRASVVSPGAERKKTFAITTTTTNLTGLSYTPGFVHVYHNGIRLVDSTDYTATDGSTITLTTAAENGDEVVVVSYGTFSPADTYTKSETYTKTESDDRYVNASGDTMTGNLLLPNLGVDTNDDTASLRLSANDTQATSGVAIQLWGKDMGSWGGGIHYIADTRGVDGSHRFWTWDGSTFVNRALIDEAGRVTMPYQPAFHATYASGYSYTFNGSNRLADYGRTVVNRGNHYNTSTSLFTAPVGGVYVFHIGCAANSTTHAAGFMVIELVVNGTLFLDSYSSSSDVVNTNEGGMSCSFVVGLNANDTVRPQMYHSMDYYTGDTVLSWPHARNYFSGYLLG